MSSKSINRIIDYIEENLTLEHSVEALSELSGMSKYHFHKTFTKTTGEKVIDYIKKRRLTQASFDLLETDKPILHIAMDYCYNSQEAFTTAFKNVFNTTPKKYRDSRYDNVDLLTTKLDKRRFSKEYTYRLIEKDEITLIGFDDYLEDNEYHKLFDLYYRLYLLIVKNQYPMKEIKVYEVMEVVNYSEDRNGNYKIDTKHFIGIEYNPDVMKPEGIKQKIIPYSKFAVFEHKGSSEHISDTIRDIYVNRLTEINAEPKDYTTIKVYDERVYGELFDSNNKVKDKYLYMSSKEYLSSIDRSTCLMFSHDYEFDIYISIE